MATSTEPEALPEELAALDALDVPTPRAPGRLARAWSVTWPKLGAVVLALVLWQVVVWSGWKEEYVLPGPRAVLDALFSDLDLYLEAASVTLRRGVTGFAVALLLGTVVGAAVARVRVLRAAFGSMITGLQTMPSIAWFPAALVLFGLRESAIFFVVVIGAFPSIANGLIAGVDNTPPLLMRAARMLGARGWRSLRYVILPAALPTYVAGLKQGWAFAWRSLLAGELLVLIAGKPSLGRQLDAFRQTSDYTSMYATMLVILFVGIVVDSLFFGVISNRIRRRYGLVDTAS